VADALIKKVAEPVSDRIEKAETFYADAIGSLFVGAATAVILMGERDLEMACH
jgi:hypothetical protein